MSTPNPKPPLILRPVLPIIDGLIDYVRERPYNNAKKDVIKRTEKWHARLPKARRGYFDATKSTPTSDQSQSIFFGKLPLEVRELIYENMGGDLIKVKILGEWCQVAVPGRIWWFPGAEWETYGRKSFKLKCPMLLEKVVFARSCKIAYQEALHFVYTTNTFYLPNITSFFCFQNLLPTHLLNAITSLHLRWINNNPNGQFEFIEGSPPGNLATWKQTWNVISSMKNLSHIRVDMLTREMGIYPSVEDTLCAIMKDYHTPQNIEVYLNWCDWTRGSSSDWPFKVTNYDWNWQDEQL